MPQAREKEYKEEVAKGILSQETYILADESNNLL